DAVYFPGWNGATGRRSRGNFRWWHIQSNRSRFWLRASLQSHVSIVGSLADERRPHDSRSRWRRQSDRAVLLRRIDGSRWQLGAIVDAFAGCHWQFRTAHLGCEREWQKVLAGIKN